MSNFVKVVRNYEQICRERNYKDLVKKASPTQLKNLEERIQEFVEITKKANGEWEKNPNSINEYWTGLKELLKFSLCFKTILKIIIKNLDWNLERIIAPGNPFRAR